MKRLIFAFLLFPFALFGQVPGINSGVPYVETVEATGLLNGLVAAWNPTNGTTLYDEHSNYDGTITGASYSNNFLSYDGTNDYVDIGDIGDLGTQYSVEVIFSTNTVSGNNMIVCYRTDNRTNANNLPIQIDHNNSDLRFLVRDNSNHLANATASGVLSASTLYHAVAVRDGNNIELFLDNSSVATGSASLGTLYMNRLTLAAFYYDSDVYNTIWGNWFNGDIGFVRIWNRALTSAEISTLYNSGSYLDYSNFSAQIEQSIRTLWNSFYENVNEVQTLKIAS